jgi:DNA repair protein RecN (Recombination protein N)
MLTRLRIERFALIDELDIELPAGFVAMTGETGAGKSMLLGAVAAALGARVHREVLHEAGPTRVECLFEPGDPADLLRELAALGLPAQLPLRVRREITPAGRSRAWVGEAPCGLRELKHLARILVDFHGQRDLAQLLERERHADLLDALPAVASRRAEHDAAWQAWRRAAEELHRLERQRERQRERRELWTYQAEELERLAAQPGEDQALAAEQRVLANAEELKRTGHELAQRLLEGEHSLQDAVAEAAKALERVARLDAAFAEPRRLLDEAALLLQEAAGLCAARAEAIDWDPERLAQVQERLGQLDRLIRKYGGSLESLLARHRELDEALRAGDTLDRDCRAAAADCARLEEELEKARRTLSKARRDGAAALSAGLAPLLAELGIVGGRFDVGMEDPGGPREPVGAERPAFYISTNPDTPLGPLEQIASGGELSRVMLALKVLLLGNAPGQCLVFDEIDAGLSGRAALAVSRLLQRLAARHQLLCITHLAPIAAAARAQLLVEKTWDGSRTRVSVTTLDPAGRRRQIARLQAGEEGDAELAAAQRLLERQAGDGS